MTAKKAAPQTDAESQDESALQNESAGPEMVAAQLLTTAPKAYEYQSVRLEHAGQIDLESLNAWGAQGWRVVMFIESTPTLILCRELAQAAGVNEQAS